MKKWKHMWALLLVLFLFSGVIRSQAATGDILAVFASGTQSSKDGGTITWQFANVDTGGELGDFTVILSGSGSTLDYAPEYCVSYNWRPVPPWATAGNGANASRVVVKSGIKSIGISAFCNMYSLTTVILEEGVVSIGDSAFAGNRMLQSIYIPDSVSTISSNAFGQISSSAVIYCSKNSYARVYAMNKGLTVKLTDCGHENAAWVVTKQATCTGTGQKALKCPDCGETVRTETLPILAHSWGAWTTVSAATTSVPKTQKRTCTLCSKAETRTVGSVLPSTVKVSSLKITGVRTLLAGKKAILKLSVSPTNASNKAVTWTSSNTRYATVSQNGVVTAKAAGAGKTVTITAKAKDGSGKKATWKITIKGAVTKIKLTAVKTLKVGYKTVVKAAVTVGKGGSKALTWTSSNKKYAVVTQMGAVRALKAGKGHNVIITAKAKDGSGKKASVIIKIK